MYTHIWLLVVTLHTKFIHARELCICIVITAVNHKYIYVCMVDVICMLTSIAGLSIN